jgi:hypothetical protein
MSLSEQFETTVENNNNNIAEQSINTSDTSDKKYKSIVSHNIELEYEIKDSAYSIDIEEKNDIDSMLNSEGFFSDFKEQFDIFDHDNMTALHVDYFENYNLKMLYHITNYYNIPKKKLRKEELIQLIVLFESDPDNTVAVYNRKRFWHYLHELKTDQYFGKFVIFN